MKIEDNSTVGGFIWLFCVVYTFMYWGLWFGIVSIFFPIFPIIDLAKFIGRF